MEMESQKRSNRVLLGSKSHISLAHVWGTSRKPFAILNIPIHFLDLYHYLGTVLSCAHICGDLILDSWDNGGPPQLLTCHFSHFRANVNGAHDLRRNLGLPCFLPQTSLPQTPSPKYHPLSTSEETGEEPILLRCDCF